MQRRFTKFFGLAVTIAVVGFVSPTFAQEDAAAVPRDKRPVIFNKPIRVADVPANQRRRARPNAQTDRSIWYDRTGEEFVIEDIPNLPPPPPRSPVVEELVVPVSATFTLHSRPSATRKIYLDFDGHTITNNIWNQYTGQASYYGGPLDFDNEPGSFSVAEHEGMQQIWRMVAEDFAPFDVDVTTQDPGSAGINRESFTDVNYGTRVHITSGAPFCACGGIAYLGVFDAVTSVPEFYQPAMVFVNNLSRYPKYIAEAVSHEVGHNLNLNHDGDSFSTYYTGHDNWAPIMGVGYSKPVVQWSNGTYSGANNQQNDFATIGAYVAPIPVPGPQSLGVAGTSGVFDKTGIIGTTSQEVVYTFSVSAADIAANKRFSAFVTPKYGPTPNLNAHLKVRQVGGSTVATSPINGSGSVNFEFPTGMSAEILGAQFTQPGSYELVVTSEPGGDPTTSYDPTYSLGAYVLSGTFSARSGTDSVPTNVVLTPNTFDPKYRYSATVTWTPPVGGTPATAWTVQLNPQTAGQPILSLSVQGAAVNSVTFPWVTGSYRASVVKISGSVVGEYSAPSEESTFPALGAPSQTTAAVNGNGIRVNWVEPATLNAPVVEYYLVKLTPIAGGTATYLWTPNNVTELTLFNVAFGTYQATVQARNSFGQLSNPSQASSPVALGVLPPPTNVTATNTGSAVTINWTAPTTPPGVAAITYYRVQLTPTAGGTPTYQWTNGPTTSLTLNNVDAGTYQATVQSYNGNTSTPSTPSNTITVL
jgi:hypothetical protein